MFAGVPEDIVPVIDKIVENAVSVPFARFVLVVVVEDGRCEDEREILKVHFVVVSVCRDPI